MNLIRITIIIALFLFPFRLLSLELFDGDIVKQEWIQRRADAIVKASPTLNQEVLRKALVQYQEAKESGSTHSSILTVVDFTMSSGTKRLWVIDLDKDQILFHELVSHGRNSGDHRNATKFSNKPKSLQSSLGLFLTGPSYVGKAFGPSLKLQGLNKGINDNAFMRGIVLHGAPYVSEERAKKLGNIGRSYGCFSVRRDAAKPLINTIKNGTLIFAYHPQLNA